MINKTILDNLHGQEIKELITKKRVSLEELDTAALKKLFNYETDMLCIDEGDVELINACAKRLDELNGPVVPQEHFWEVINDSCAEKVSASTITVPAEIPSCVPVRTVKRRLVYKRIWIVAAVIALLAATATITASAFGYNVFEYFREVMCLSAGEKVNKGSVTLVHYAETEVFSSVDELLKSEGLDILYPSVLPDGVVLEQVHISEGTNDGNFVQFVTNDQSNYISVDTTAELTGVTEYTEQLYIGDFTYYIYGGENFAVCYHKGCYYYISSDSYENLILIIKNMEEIK